MIRFNRRLGINTGIRLTGADYKIRYGTGTFAGASGTLQGNGGGLFVAFIF